jgi:DNA repair exonuclease SbcCD nuclease subunit
MIRIVHTADNHIGMKFNSRYPANVSERLVNERIDALKRIIGKANEFNAHFIVIAGDLFDSVSISQKDIKTTADALGTFNGDVIIIPGNHDFYEEFQGKLWNVFKEFSKSNVHFLAEDRPYEFSVLESKVVFYPGGCRSKCSSNNAIGWIENKVKDSETLNVGIAHGNMEGIGLDYEDKYFNMTPSQLKDCELDFWLLGHIHVPFPSNADANNANFFYSATPTPDGFNYLREGYCWYLEFDDKKLYKLDQWITGGLRFYDKKFVINDESDIENISNELNKIDKANSLARITVEGRITELQRHQLVDVLKECGSQFLYFSLHNETVIKLQKQQIDSLYTENSLPHTILTQLSKTDDSDLALQLAHQLIEEVKK